MFGAGDLKNAMRNPFGKEGRDAAKEGIKDFGDRIGEMNPYRKGPTYKPQDVADAPQITAPTFDPNAFKGPATVQGAPTSFQGGAIREVADPRQVLINAGDDQQWRGDQRNLAAQLAEQATGRGPSLATEQLNQAQKANQAAAFAQLASQRGGPSAAMARQTQQTSAAIQRQTARDAAVARIQEQMGAREQLAGVLNQGRAMDQQIAIQQAGLQQEAALAKYKGELERAIQQGTLDQRTAEAMFAEASTTARTNAANQQQYAMEYNRLVAEYARMGMDAQKANQMAAMAVESARRGEQSMAFQSRADAEAKQKAQIAGLINTGAGMGMTFATAGLGAAAPAASAATSAAMQGAQAPGNMGAYTATPAATAIQNDTFQQYYDQTYTSPYAPVTAPAPAYNGPLAPKG